MKASQTLRARIAFYFCGYLALLLTVYSGALILMLNISEDRAFNRQLAQISNRLARHIDAYGQIPLYLPMHITAYTNFANVPEELQRYVKNRDPGIFEIDAGEGLDYHISLVPLPVSGQLLYVFYDVGSLETTDRFESFLTFTLVGIGLGVLLMGWLLAHSLSNRILNPISQLAGTVQSLSPDEDSVTLRSFNTPDEVGVLAERINQLLQRIAEFTRREREFTSHASHELRTPVTVIKGAMEILKSRRQATDLAIQKPVLRIERAVKDIEMLIDTFLLLARQGQVPDVDDTCELPAVVDRVVAAYGYLLEGKPVEVSVETADAGRVQAPTSLVTIALGNLVRNAFQYTPRGKVEILALADRVRVCDSGPGIESSRPSAGLGLTIVERLCERMNWRFSIAGTPGEGTRAELIFGSIAPITVRQNRIP
jgi:signal transduction histidine kinase